MLGIYESHEELAECEQKGQFPIDGATSYIDSVSAVELHRLIEAQEEMLFATGFDQCLLNSSNRCCLMRNLL